MMSRSVSLGISAPKRLSSRLMSGVGEGGSGVFGGSYGGELEDTIL